MKNLLLSGLGLSAKTFADKPAVITSASHTSYADMWRCVSSFAGFLQRRISPGDRVAVLLENGPEYIEACYGSWGAAAVMVGLNTALKANELVHQIDHCGAKWLVIDVKNKAIDSIVSDCTNLENLVLIGDEQELDLAVNTYRWHDAISMEQAASFVEVADTDLACIIYTSGTTGRPKGVGLSHANLAANMEAIRQYLDIRADDRVMCVLPFFYSYGNSVLHSHLLAGATLVLENQFLYPNLILEKMAQEQVTSFAGVPSTYYLLLSRTQLANYDLSALRYCTQAGGPMKSERITEFRQALPNTEFIVMYGQTEATARLSYLPFDRLEEKSGSVGIAIPGVQLAILDEKGVALQRGMTGEVCARGENIMLGYFSDQQSSDEVIVDGWLRTGDLGYFDEQGFLYLVGRAREMIKTGAHRISPREIEELLLGLPEINDVAVIGVPDELLGQVVKACVIATDDSAQLKKKIMKYCRDQLASYKVPKAIEFYTNFPSTSSGKIQKHLLN